MEVFKYAVKFSDLSLDDNWHAAQLLKGKRLLNSFGLFRGVEVLLAERGVVQPYLAHREVLPEMQVVATAGEARGGLYRFDRWSAAKVLQHRQGPCVRLAVAC